jgi:nicotinamidase-related amidase
VPDDCTALLVMDTQEQIVARYAEADMLVPAGRGIAAARANGLMVVYGTLRAAADLEYQLIVLGDCCADDDPEVHRVLLEKVFPRHAEVLDAESWERRLAG